MALPVQRLIEALRLVGGSMLTPVTKRAVAVLRWCTAARGVGTAIDFYQFQDQQPSARTNTP